MNPSIYKPRYVVLNIKAPESTTTQIINKIKKILTTRNMGALCKVQMVSSEQGNKRQNKPFNFNAK